MRHTTILLGLTLLLTVLPGTSAARGDSDTLKPDDIKKSLENIDRTLQAFNEAFRGMDRRLQEINVTLSSTALAMKLVKEDLDRLKDEATRVRDERTRLEQRLARLEGDLERVGRRAFAEGPVTAAGTGTIVLENQNSLYTAIVTINGTAYVVPPLQGRRLDRMPAGPFTHTIYTEWAGLRTLTQGTVTRELRPNATYTITITP